MKLIKKLALINTAENLAGLMIFLHLTVCMVILATLVILRAVLH